MSEFQIGPTQFSYLVAVYGIGAFISNLAGIFFLDLFDRRKAIIVIYGGFLLGTFGCALSNSYESLLVVRFFTGLFGGLNGALIFSIVSDLYVFKKRGRAMGALMAGFSAAAALGIPLGLFFSYNYSWNHAFYFIAIFGLVVHIAILFSFPPIRKHLEEKTMSLSAYKKLTYIVSDLNQVRGLAFGVILVFGHMIAIPFIAPYMERNIGFSQNEMIYMYLFGGFLTVFSTPFFGKLVDRFGALRVYTILLFISFIPTIWVTSMTSNSVVLAIVATSLFFIFGSGRMIAPQAMISAVVSSETRGSFMSFKAALQQLAIALASLISGMIVKETANGMIANYHWVGYLSCILLLFTFFFAGKLKVVKGN